MRRKPAPHSHDFNLALLTVFAGLILAAMLIVFLYPFTRQPSSGPPESSSLDLEAMNTSTPFTISDLNAEQLTLLRERGTLRVSDGPRGISIGDSMDRLLAAYPTDFSGTQSNDEQILYCAAYFENRNGIMTALPPRGILRDDDGRSIVITLLAPTSPYPEGTADDYLRYEHIFCRYTVNPEDMTVSSILLGIEK